MFPIAFQFYSSFSPLQHDTVLSLLPTYSTCCHTFSRPLVSLPLWKIKHTTPTALGCEYPLIILIYCMTFFFALMQVAPSNFELIICADYFFSDGNHVNMKDEEWKDPHCVATVLKMFFEELPNSLFSHDKYNFLICAFKSK